MKTLGTSLFVSALICAVCVQASADDTWDGGDATGDWSDGDNWADNGSPAGDAFEALTFTGAGEVTDNDLGAGLSYRSITFDGSAGAFTINGDSILIDDSPGISGFITNLSSSTQLLGLDIAILGDSMTFSTPSTGGMTFGGAISMPDAIDLLSIITGIGVITIEDGGITGDGAIDKSGSGTLILTSDNTFTGGLTISGGTVQLGSSDAAGTGTITILGSTLEYTDGIDVDNLIDLLIDATLTIGGGLSATQSGVISETGGPFGISKEGLGTLTLTATNTFTGGAIVNGGTLNLDTPTGSLAGSVFVNSTGTFNMLDAANTVGDDLFVNSGGTAGGIGTITDDAFVNGGGTLTPGLSVGTFIVGDDFFLNPGSMLDVEVDTAIPLGDPNGNDLVDVGDDVFVNPNSLIRVRSEDDDPFADDGAGDVDFTAGFLGFTGGGTGSADPDGLGGEFTIIDVGGDLSGDLRMINIPIWTNYGVDTLGSDVSPTDLDGLLIFPFIPFEDSLDLMPATFLGLAGPSGADSMNPGIGNAIDDLIALANAGGTPSTAVQAFFADFLDFIDPNADGYTTLTLDDWQTLINETDAGLNTVGVTSQLVIVDGFRGYNNNQTTYLQARRDGDVQAFARSREASQLGGPMLASMDVNPAVMVDAINSVIQAQPDPVVQGTRMQEWGAWVKGFGLTNELDTSSHRTGYESDTYGIMGGVDYQITEGLIVGVSGGYIQTDADFDMSLGDIDMDTYRVGPYVSFSRGAWYVEGSATYGHSEIDRTRTTTLLGTSTSDNEADDWTISAGGGYTFEISDQLNVTPIASLYYIHFDQDGYTESGGVLPMTIDDYDSDALYSRLGVRATYRVVHENLTIVPEVYGGWEHEYLGDDDPVDASLVPGAGVFTVQVAEPESDSAFFGGGVSVLINDNVTIFGRYDGLYNGETEAHGVSGGVTLWF